MNTNDEELTFLRAIIAEPDEDKPRLVFSDWLEERGQSDRSEFIRVQCELVRMPTGPLYADPESPADRAELRRVETLRRRERELLIPDNARQWVITPPDYKTLAYVRPGNVAVECYYDHPGVPNWRSVQWFRRGFVDEISLDWNDWIEADRVLLAMTPIRHIRLATWPLGASGIGYWRTNRGVKLPGARFTKTSCLPDNWTVGGVTLELLRLEWPMVRKWTLPDEATSTMLGATGTLNFGDEGLSLRWIPVTGGTASLR